MGKIRERSWRALWAFLLCSSVLQVAAQKPDWIPGTRKPGYRLTKTWKPSMFQGGHRKHGYYEGWYFKCVNDDGRCFALIPGIAMAEKGGDNHAFIQYIDGKTAETRWYEFPATDFRYSQRGFRVEIGNNWFCEDSLHVDVGEGGEHLQADLRFEGLHPFRVKAFSPGIMGWYRFVPGMETCHGLVSWHHSVRGRIVHDGQSHEFVEGKGYIEKDWGTSFPRSYVWMQCNSFGARESSFMCSIATIPYLGKYFTGFLGFLWVDDKLYRFATYTHAKLENLAFGENMVSFEVKEREFCVKVHASRQLSGILKAPQVGQMERRISESVEAEIDIALLDRKGKLLWQGTGKSAGLEIVGNIKELMAKP